VGVAAGVVVVVAGGGGVGVCKDFWVMEGILWRGKTKITKDP